MIYYERAVYMVWCIGVLYFRLLDYRESGRSCKSLVPITVELRPSANEVKKDSVNMGFMLPTEQVCMYICLYARPSIATI